MIAYNVVVKGFISLFSCLIRSFFENLDSQKVFFLPELSIGSVASELVNVSVGSCIWHEEGL